MDIGVNFCCRAPFQLDGYLSNKCCEKRADGYDVPHATSISDDQVYPCCGLLELEKCYVHHHSCADVIQPFRQQLLKSETTFRAMFVTKIALFQQILFCIKNMYIYVFHFLLVLFVILLILLVLVYKCTLLNLMEVRM